MSLFSFFFFSSRRRHTRWTGDWSSDVCSSDLVQEMMTAAFRGIVPLDTRFLGGETIGELIDRVVPEIDALLADESWDVVLLVLHGAVNRAILSRALTGERIFLGAFEQAPACINVLDVDREGSFIVRP